MDERTLGIVDSSLQRCAREPRFFDRFYERFLDASPKVRERFAQTDFVRQKRALRGSLWMMLLAAEDETNGPERYLRSLADLHSSRQLDIGAELYDLWLDCLLDTVAECDPEYNPEVHAAWEQVMMVGIHYMVTRYNR
jgi:hemoglobin-like flavoprotein